MKVRHKKIRKVLFKIERPVYIGGKTPKEYQNDWTICECSKDLASCWVIATLHWDAKEPCYELQSCGMRLAESGSTKLLKWILKQSKKLEKEILNE